MKDHTDTTAWKIAVNARAEVDKEMERSTAGYGDRVKYRQMANALSHIVRTFDKLNGGECSRGCGECIACIAYVALTGRAPARRFETGDTDPM